MKIDARIFVRLYPRCWRERYGEELLLMLDDRVRLRDAVDVMLGAANEWVSHMTGHGYWNDQAQRAARALAHAACAVILFQTFVPPVLSHFIGRSVVGLPSFGSAVLWGFVSSLLQSAVTLGPVALAVALLPWRSIPYARAAATVLGAMIAFRIGSHVAWGPAEVALLLAGPWIGFRAVTIESAPELALQT